MRLPAIAAALLLASTVTAAASTASVDDLTRKLTNYEAEARTLGANLPPLSSTGGAAGQRRLVDAEVEFSLGDYDTAALTLFDLASKAQGADREAATYYLAESLYQKGDRGAARGYFQTLIKSATVQSKYYQPALQRLVEIAIADGDPSAATEALSTLDQISPGLRQPGVPYVRGKFAFSQGKYDEAVAFLNEVPKGSDFELQALYYTGAAAVAKKDLARATEIYTDLVGRKPRTSVDRRVIELGQLALGRLFYEREQPSKSIDSYLLVDRHSDLFPDALYEVAWVYVKSKQYDKALRALELLEQSEPNTMKTPTVRILEGNLRIRKAQMIRQAQIGGTINPNETSDPQTEYDKATKLFVETHDQYQPSYLALKAMVDQSQDPTAFLEQISGRSTHVFQLAAPIPEAAADWLRDTPEVQRYVSVEQDLGEVHADLDQTAASITRLEGAIGSGDHSGLYPEIASRRARIAAIQNDLVAVRNDLADQELRLVDSSSELASLTATRKQLAQQYAALGNPEQAHADRVGQAQAGFDKIDTDTLEVDSAIDSSQAIAVALRKWAGDGHVPADQAHQLGKDLDDAAREAQSIEDELSAVRKELALGRDLATLGDDSLAQARNLRKQLAQAEDAEHRVLAGFASASRDKSKSQQLAALGDRASRIGSQLEQLDGQMAQTVEQGVAETKNQLASERSLMGDLQKELADDEAEARALGASVVGSAFKAVKDKFEDVIVRTDVGVVDVAWSQKEDADDDDKRLNLSRSRELKQLKDEFRDILEQSTEKPSAPKKPEPMPMPTEGSTTSPDKGGAGDRIKPIGDQGTNPTQPTVKPDEQKNPKQQPKKGGNK